MLAYLQLVFHLLLLSLVGNVVKSGNIPRIEPPVEAYQLQIKQDGNGVDRGLDPEEDLGCCPARMLLSKNFHCLSLHEKEDTCNGVEEVSQDQFAEQMVVRFPDAVVQPLAVVIELLAAAVAGPAVLRALLHVAVTDDAVVFDRLAGVVPNRPEDLLEELLFTLLLHKNVGWHRVGADVCKPHGESSTDDECDDKKYQDGCMNFHQH